MFAFHNRYLKSILVLFMHLLMVFPARTFRNVQWTGIEHGTRTALMTWQADLWSNNPARFCQPEQEGGWQWWICCCYLMLNHNESEALMRRLEPSHERLACQRYAVSAFLKICLGSNCCIRKRLLKSVTVILCCLKHHTVPSSLFWCCQIL